MTLGLVGWFGDPAVVMFPRVRRRSGGAGLPDFTPFLLMLPPPPHEKLVGIVLALRRGTMGLLLLFFGPTIDVWTHRRMDGRRPMILVFRADGSTIDVWTHRRLDPPTADWVEISCFFLRYSYKRIGWMVGS